MVGGKVAAGANVIGGYRQASQESKGMLRDDELYEDTEKLCLLARLAGRVRRGEAG